MTVRLKPLNEQVMLITGASSGIGLVTAKQAASTGAKVMLVARSRDGLQQAVDEIEKAGGTAAFAVADVADPDALAAAAAGAVRRFGRIDTWVNNAGVAIYAKLADTPLDEHRRLFATNYFGVVNGCATALSCLRDGGALITVSSIAADIPSPVLGAYAASKHAVKAYVEALRMEVEADRLPIVLTLIKPSGIDTPIGQHAANHGPGEALIPPPVYVPELVADAICHAAAHPTRDITVGGIGRLNVLVGEHFPWLIDAITPLVRSKLFDRTRARTEENNLFSPMDPGRERSGIEHPRSFSVYTTAKLHPRLAAGFGLAGAVAASALLLRHRKRAQSMITNERRSTG